MNLDPAYTSSVRARLEVIAIRKYTVNTRVDVDKDRNHAVDPDCYQYTAYSQFLPTKMKTNQPETRNACLLSCPMGPMYARILRPHNSV